MIPIHGKQIDRRDFSEKNVRLLSPVLKLRRRLFNRWSAARGRDFWGRHSLIPNTEFNGRVAQAVANGQPLSVGRLGGVEASIVMWAKRIPSCSWRLDLWQLFADTANGATNAGIRPRNRESYRAFADLAWEALENLDLQGVWSAGYESACLQMLGLRSLFNGEITGPDGENPSHWMRALQGKRVLVVSPFVGTIQQQTSKLGKVWPKMPWLEETDFEMVAFPYLIDEGCPDTWWEVYERIGKIVSAGNYNVALFGCGGLGLPFAHLAKKAGRVGMHLGGHLQLVFGIYGQRHLDQHWFRDQMNEHWVRPNASEVPNSAKRVEGGCYW
jgi:hypothetical protein